MSHTSFSPHAPFCRRSAQLGVALLALLGASAGQAALAGTVTWDGTAADWYSNPSHWLGGSYPGSSDDAVNSSTAAMTLGQNATVNSFLSNGAFTLTGGTFAGLQMNAAGTVQVNNILTINGGGLSNFTLNPGTNGSVVFTTNGGNFLSSDIINANVNLSDASAFVHLYNTNTFNGNISLGAGGVNGIHLDNSTTSLVLGSGGSLTGFGGVYEYNGGSTFTNNGTVNANSKGNTLTLASSNFTNNGAAQATNGGILALNNTVTGANGSTFTATGAGSLITLNGAYTGVGSSLFTASGGGKVQVNGASLQGTINTAATTALMFNTSGANNLTNATVNGSLDLATDPAAFVHLYGADTVNGNISLGAGGVNGIHLDNSTTSLVLGSGGSLTGFGGVYEYNGGSTFTNNGTVNANSVGNTLNLSVSNFNNTGAAEATTGGTLALNNTTNNTGTLAAHSGGVLNIFGTLNSSSGSLLDGTGGTINILGASLLGTLNETAETTLAFNTSGANNLTNATVNGNLDLATDPAAFVHLYGADTVNGSISLGAGGVNGIHLDNSTTSLVLGSGGSLTGFGGVYEYNGGSTFTNNGTVNASSAAAPLTLAVTNFDNTGTTEATSGGTLNLNNVNTNASSGSTLAAKGTGSILSLTGTFTGTGSNLITASGGGQVQVNGASLLGTLNTDASTALMFNTSGANNLTNATVNGNLDLATDPAAFVHLYGADTVNGSISLGAGGVNGIHLDNSTTSLVLGSGGSLTGFGGVYEYNGGSTFTNNGTVNANSVGNALTLATSNFVNIGTTQVQSGAALSVTSANTDSGNILVKSGGTATFSQGVTQTAGLTQVDGTLSSPLTLTGGTLDGTGTVNGAVVNTGGMVSAGNAASPFGTLAVSGAFSQGAGGILDTVFSSTQNSLLAVNGLVTTGGVLNVGYFGSGAYLGSGPFTFLDYGTLATSLSGTGPTQYFSNETFLADGTGIIAGQNGFVYKLLNNTGINGLQLQVITNGAPVPEASTTISLGLLLTLGGLLVAVKRRRTAAASS